MPPDERLILIVGVADKTGGIFGGSGCGCGNGHILGVGRFVQEQRGISANNQRRKAALPAGLQIVVGGNLELLNLTVSRATTTNEQRCRNHGKNRQHDDSTTFRKWRDCEAKRL